MAAELQALVMLLDDREAAIRQGMTIDGQRHEVRAVAGQQTSSCVLHASRALRRRSCLFLLVNSMSIRH